MLTKKQSQEESKKSNGKNTQQKLFSNPGTNIQKSTKSRIIIKFDVGFSNILYLRGKGANLNWDQGIPLKNIKADEWIWETETPFTNCEFKVLINDKQYEIGENHLLKPGATVSYTPNF